MRSDGREQDQLRTLRCQTDINIYAEGSCIFETGRTRVHCTATISRDLPRWRRDSGAGWVNAEYRMLPRSTSTRSLREGRFDTKGRTAEIQRLIGRALRSVVDMRALGPRQVHIDCDVLQADGGTRTASVNGGFVAMVLGLQSMVEAGDLKALPLRDYVAAVSVGIVDSVAMLDLAYDEDSRADVDMNVVMTGKGQIVELQGTAEGAPFSLDQLKAQVDMARKGIKEILAFLENTTGPLDLKRR